MHSAQSCGLGACPQVNFKIRYFEIEFGGIFCKMHVILPIPLNIKQVKSWGEGGSSKPRGASAPPSSISLTIS